MKQALILLCLSFTMSAAIVKDPPVFFIQDQPVQNLFIITLDGFRWNELFNGADEALINNSKFTSDTGLTKLMYWSNTPEERRKQLLPFMWNVIGKKGQLYGNRRLHSKVNVSNVYNFSYPGYNETLTGNADIRTNSNDKKWNPNINVLEHLNKQPEFKNKVVAFTSWDVFPYLLNVERNGLLVNSGYPKMNYTGSVTEVMINKVQEEALYNRSTTRYDALTFITAKEYIKHHQPKVVYLSLGETDDLAHEGKYDLYLQKAADSDRMIAELWQLVQTTPAYKNNTSFIITTDHGRGRKNNWTKHGMFLRGSSETWLALIGPNVPALGEANKNQQIYHYQLPELMANLLGQKFK